MENDGERLVVEATQPDIISQSPNVDESQITTNNNARKLPQYVAAITATLSALAAGTVLGWTAPINDVIEKGGFNNITVTISDVGWIGSLPNLGAILGCLPTGFICDLIGRKSTLLSLIIPYCIGWLSIIFARNVTAILVGRFFLGIAAGAGCIVGPIYCSEIAQNEIRGTLGSYFQLMITIGILFAYVFGTVLTTLDYTLSCAMIPLVFCLLFACQPETPLYYLKRDKYEHARVALKRLRGCNYNIDNELAELDYVVKSSTASLGIFRELNTRAARRSMSIAICLMVFQQFSGINALIFYAADIFKDSQINLDSNFASIIIGVAQVISTFFSSLMVDRYGRKILLLISTYFMGVSVLSLAIFLTFKVNGFISKDLLASLNFFPVLCLLSYIILFSIGLGPVPWLVISEVFTPGLKGTGSSLAVTLNWFWSFVITRTFLDVEKQIGQNYTFFGFGFCLLLAAFLISRILPETKGKSIAEIQAELQQ